ncbi:MAG TPA: RpiB/LacA/LacB family sugar-phosphate isomerase [Candidatus Bathyarchaeia archaeon]|nr:RpiB/LacA/LacB family sugar-phosphate isomerase [Candidatus Bathyarchaeia archaeon]
MKIAVGSDEQNHLTDFVLKELKKRGHKTILCGALRKSGIDWVGAAKEVAEKVTKKEVDEGILFCWTGTGVSIVANKIPGIRAALCADAKTAEGARTWNHANILALSYRLTSEEVAQEILDAWFSTPPDPKEAKTTRKVEKIEKPNL